MDKARIHHAREVKDFIRCEQLPVLYSGVDSCASVLVEMLFSFLFKRLFGKACAQINEERESMARGSR